MPSFGESVRAAHAAHTAAVADDLTGPDSFILKPGWKDWETVKGHWDSTCTNFNPNHGTLETMWALWMEEDL